MPAFIDVTCHFCNKRYGFCGEAEDQPPCPSCGKSPSIEILQSNAKEIAAFKEFLIEKKRVKDLENKLTDELLKD
jgi:hypothetical protein